MVRFLTFCLFIFIFCDIGFHAVHPHDDHSVLYKGGDSPWQVQLQEFHKLLKTDTDAANSELQHVARRLFGEQILAQEWIPLYFRINKEGTQYSSDLKRVSELEIRMLKSIDPEKYAKQIQHHQEAIEHYAAFSNKRMQSALPSDADGKGSIDSLTLLEIDVSENPIWELRSFFQLLPKDPKAARTILNKHAAQVYENHPHAEEWTKLFFRHHRDKKAKLLDSIRVKELERQMLSDIDAQKHAASIKVLERLIKHQKRLQKTFERQGNPNPTIDVEVRIKKED